MKLHQTIIALSLASSSFLCMGMNKTVDTDGFITRTPKLSARKQQTKIYVEKIDEKKEVKIAENKFKNTFGYSIPTSYDLSQERKAQLAQKREETSSNISSAQKTDVLNTLYLQFNAQSPAPRHVKNALKQESINQDMIHCTIPSIQMYDVRMISGLIN